MFESGGARKRRLTLFVWCLKLGRRNIPDRRRLQGGRRLTASVCETAALALTAYLDDES